MTAVNKLFTFLVLIAVFCGCRTTESTTLSQKGGSDRLAGESYCRMVGSLGGGGQVETCLNFGAAGSGVETDTSGGIPRNTQFSYSVDGSDVTIVVSDSPARSRTREMTLSSDGSTLSYREGSNTFVWTLSQ